MVNPQAHYDALAFDGILVLQRGENASTDYYIRPRLESVRAPVLIADLDDAPDTCPLLADDACKALMVIVCRYGAEPWLRALEARRGRLSRVAYFTDDDLPAVMRAQDLPRTVRGKAALHYGAQVGALSALASEVWVSTPVLAGRYAEARPVVLPPLPETEPPEPAADPPRRVVYHGTDVHRAERQFVLEVARRLAGMDPAIDIELTGDDALARASSGLPNLTVVPQLAWPDYLRRQQGARAAVSLAPLFPSPLNAARAPVKAFDAARLGAAGIYARGEPYGGFVRDGLDGLLLPMDPDVWAGAIRALVDDPARRLSLARAAHARLVELRRTDPGFPAG